MSEKSLDLPPIPNTATLRQWQDYVGEIVQKRGWGKADNLEIFLLFTEEVGELAKAFRQHRELFTEESKCTENSKRELAHEMADVLSYLLDLANRMDIDLEQAAKEKEEINRGRHWD